MTASDDAYAARVTAQYLEAPLLAALRDLDQVMEALYATMREMADYQPGQGKPAWHTRCHPKTTDERYASYWTLPPRP